MDTDKTLNYLMNRRKKQPEHWQPGASTGPECGSTCPVPSGRCPADQRSPEAWQKKVRRLKHLLKHHWNLYASKPKAHTCHSSWAEGKRSIQRRGRNGLEQAELQVVWLPAGKAEQLSVCDVLKELLWLSVRASVVFLHSLIIAGLKQRTRVGVCKK